MPIFGYAKGIPAHTSNRLQRWAIILLSYDFDIEYMRTTDFGHADVLSRLIANNRTDKEDFVIAALHLDKQYEEDLSRGLLVKFEDIGISSLKDPVISEVLGYVSNGWPASTQSIKSGEVIKYFAHRLVLTRINDTLIYRDRTVVPPEYRKTVLKSLHHAHPGISRMTALARQYMYWPGMDQDIRTLVGTCVSCQANAKAPVKTLLASWPTPSEPWQRVHADFAGPFNGKTYLVLIDAYSKWPEVSIMGSTTAQLTITRVKESCARLGNMSTVVSDNGPQFTSEAFKLFCTEQHISHIRTPPYHPQSNGLCERFVGTLKSFLDKSRNRSEDELLDFLRIYRATPNESAPFGKSPAELLLGRKLRIPLTSLLPPSPPSTGAVDTAMEKEFNRKHGAKNREFVPGEEVHARLAPNTKWKTASVFERKGKVVYTVLLIN